MRLTLDDVLEAPEFGLELRAGPCAEANRSQRVDGAHCIDLSDPVRWLQEGWIMLTTGVQLRGSATAQRRLVAQLSEGRIAALGLGLGIAMQDVPPALVEEAERRGFPVFSVPLETPFREIVSFVNRSAVSTDLSALRRLSTMQRYLLDAMHRPDPEQALVERLASLLGGADVAYLDRAGEPIATTAPDLDFGGGSLDPGDGRLRELESAGRAGVVAPVGGEGTRTGWLIALLSDHTVTRQVARPVVRTAGELLELVVVTRLAGARGRRATRERLGDRLARVLGGERDDGLAAALADEGLDFTEPCRLAVLGLPDGTGDGAGIDATEGDPARRAALEGLADALEDAGANAVLTLDGDRALVLAQDELPHLEDILRDAPALRGVRAGLSGPIERLDELAGAADEARLGLAVARTGPDAPLVARHDRLDPGVALLAGRSLGRLRERLVGALAPLEGEPRLRAAVVAYLDAGLDVGRAGQVLGLHRNSVRYRLDRAERLLGRSLRSPATVTAIHLALLAEQLQAGEDPALDRPGGRP